MKSVQLLQPAYFGISYFEQHNIVRTVSAIKWNIDINQRNLLDKGSRTIAHITSCLLFYVILY